MRSRAKQSLSALCASCISSPTIRSYMSDSLYDTRLFDVAGVRGGVAGVQGCGVLEKN